ncbi:AT-hook motif nuclear-localized protein 14 isoform X2 [Coffea arabica]|uniref:AT-hook motif nuclear-localized protein n=1 Tax=Coffea arabica TaxID=13443 RepID=A0ABM4WEB7_COFAR
MDPNESSELSSYFHHPQQPPPPSPLNPTAPTTAVGSNTSPTNGILPNTSNPAASTTTTTSSPLVYGTVPSVVTSGGAGLDSGKRKRGRPRKYGTPGEAAAAKRLSSASTAASISPPKKKDLGFGGGGGGSTSSASSKKYQLAASGSTGQSFIPHVITVAAGEGRFDILSLCGSYVRTELGGRTGGLSVCLSSTDGQIIGGGVGGPLTAAGPIQIIVGTFVIDPKKDITGGLKGDTSAGKSPSPIGGASFSGVSFWSPIDSSYQNIGGSQFMIQPQPRSTQAPSQAMEWSGHPGQSVQQSPENGNYPD